MFGLLYGFSQIFSPQICLLGLILESGSIFVRLVADVQFDGGHDDDLLLERSTLLGDWMDFWLSYSLSSSMV